MKHKVEEIMAMVKGGDLDVKVWKQVFNKEGSILHYSTDISAAWQVVEKMLSEGFSFSLQKQITTATKPTWECCFRNKPPASSLRSILDAPEAICKAALLAKLKGG